MSALAKKSPIGLLLVSYWPPIGLLLVSLVGPGSRPGWPGGAGGDIFQPLPTDFFVVVHGNHLFPKFEVVAHMNKF